MYAPPLFDAPFIFLRHGETETNRLGLTAGMTDVALNEHGKLQAQAAAAALVDQGVDALYSSPLKRSLATAECIGRLLHLPIVTIAELGERNWGTQEGLPRQTRDRAAKPEGGESLEEFTARTLNGLAKIPRSRLPLIVAHSGTFRVICAQLGMDIESQVENCRPLRFSPPRDRAERWRVEPL
ncbi:MAG TPA: histidine phosphatase family protein [Burkholderiales bacterium]|nr:histidine phosphatase family protein [Burkholderiales bacterium]